MKINKINNDIKKLIELKLEIEELMTKREKELKLREELLNKKNCYTCDIKKCPIKKLNWANNDCENYKSKEYKYMLKMKEGRK